MYSIRWYHLCAALGLVVALVIVSGLWLHHGTIESFHALLARSAALDAQQRDATAIGQDVLELGQAVRAVVRSNPAGSDGKKLRRLQIHLGEIKARTTLRADRMEDIWDSIRQIASAGDAAEHARQPPVSFNESNGAAGDPDRIDSLQLAALRRLAGVQEALLSDAAELQVEHARVMDRQDAIERVLAAALIAALAGMLWFTRRWRRTDGELQIERRRADEERRERLAVIGELCTGVAHGIQNPLASIQSSGELMLELDTLGPAARGRAREILGQCARLTRRVRRLLAFARTPRPTRSVVDVADVIRDVVDEWQPQFADRRVGLSLQLEGRLLPVLADDEELATILLELLSNALEHSPAGGNVRVTCATTGGAVRVEVRDNGAGVPQGSTEHIFDLFFTTRESGTGVGLAWARRIAASLGGRLDYVSSGGPGSVFRLELPLHRINGRGVEVNEVAVSGHPVESLAGRSVM